jgi:uncharacterized glyoxalase superfamily protein PhnB
MSATATSFRLRSLAPVLVVDSVEPCLDFWVDQLAFSKENEVPGPDGKVLFASVKKDDVEIMYQSRASVAADSPEQAAELTGHSTALFITVPTVADLDAIEARVKNAPSVKPRHETFYGSIEFYVREPGGNVVGFAAFK